MRFISTFSELNKNDANIAGGKGASLGEMTQAGIPVPPGFVVLSSTFDQFIKDADLVQEIEAVLDTVHNKEIHTIENASEKIQALIKNAVMPEAIATEIKTQFKNLDSEFVAVRSSATAEDGAENAWAGQLDSYLNIKEGALLEKVQHCWASLFTPRAIFYRFEKGLHTTQISVAVVVQKMINSEISGIAFSVHPVTEDRNQIIVEAGFGLGEAIVSGSITPDSYVIEKEPRKILDINVSSQTKGLYRVSTGGNEWMEIPEPKASSQALNEKQILEFSELVMRIENHYGFPCDIEWAFEDGKFYIVQSRPITTLSSKNADAGIVRILSHQKEELVLVGNRRTDRFQAELRIKGWTEGLKRELGVGYKKIRVDSTGEHYADQESENEINGIIRTKSFADFTHYAKKMADFEGDNFSDLFAYFLIARRIAENIYEKSPTQEQEIINEWRNNESLFKPLDLYTETYPQNDLEHDWSLVFFNGVLSINDQIHFEKIYTRDTTYIMQEIWAYGCSEGIEKEFGWKNPCLPGIIHHMNQGSIEIWENLRATQWLEDTILKRNTEDSEFIDEVLKKYKEKLSVLHALWRKKILPIEDLERLIELSKEAIMYFILYYYAAVDERTPKDIREKALEMRNTDEFFAENDMVIRDSLVHMYPELKGYETALFFDELESIQTMDVLKARRESSFIVQGKEKFVGTFDEFVRAHPNCIFKKEVVDQTDINEIKGEIAQKGKVTGRVKIIRRRDQIGEVTAEDIIVSPMTTPDFLPAMKVAKAFVTDEGGITCHAGIVARELKKPCIIGTKIATQVFKDGDIVEVDADTGIVRKI